PAYQLAPPDAGGEELAGQPPPAAARPVRDVQRRVQPDDVPRLAEPVVHLPVLAAEQRLVVAPDVGEGGGTHHPEVGGLGRTALDVLAVVRPASEAET